MKISSNDCLPCRFTRSAFALALGTIHVSRLIAAFVLGATLLPLVSTAQTLLFGSTFEDGTLGNFTTSVGGITHVTPVSIVTDADSARGKCVQLHTWAQGETGTAKGGSDGPHFRSEINKPGNGQYTLRYNKTVTWRWSHKLVTWPTWPWSADNPASFIKTYPDIMLAQIHHWKSGGSQGFELVDATTNYWVNFDGTRVDTGVPVVRNQWEDWELIAVLGPAVNTNNNITADTKFTLKRKVNGQYVQIWTGTKDDMLWMNSTKYESNGLREPYLKNGIYDHYRRGDLVSTTGYSRNGPELKLWCSEANLYEGVFSATTPTAPAAPSSLTASAISGSQINLSWTDNSDNETGFEVDRAANSSFSSGLVTDTNVGANTTSYQSTGLTASFPYYYRVRATNASADSANSNTANATTLAEGTVIFSDTFSYPNGALPSNYWSEGNTAQVQDGRLYVNANGGTYNVSTIWLNQAFSGDLRIEYDAHVLTSANDVNNINNFVLYSDPSGVPLYDTRSDRLDGSYTKYHDLNGYITTYVKDSGSGRFRLRDVPGFTNLLAEAFTYNADRGVTRHVVIQKVGDRITYNVDGIKILEVVDNQFNPVHQQGLFGFRTFGTELWWDNLVITDLSGVGGGSATLVGHWQLNETSGATAADSSGNGNNGALSNGPVWTSGQIGGGLSFDGVDDVVNGGSGSTLDNLPGITVAAWINPANMGEGGFGRIVSKAVDPTFSSGWHFMKAGTNQLTFSVRHATANVHRRTNPNTITTGSWQHVAVTWDGSTAGTNIKVYVNGTEVSGYDTTTNGDGARADDASSSLHLGNNSGGDRTFNGTMDDVRVYSGVLSASEIAALYEGGSGDTTAPTVAVTSPADQATVLGASVSVTADASDNVGVVGVQFKLDGVNLGAEDTTSPYSVTWDTTGATNGSHTLTAVARDAAGNSTTSSVVNVIVDNLDHSQAPFGYTISIYNVGRSMYVRADSGESYALKADATAVSAATKFTVVDNGDGSLSLKHTGNDQYAYPDPNTYILHATGTSIGVEDKYTWVSNGDGTISLTSNKFNNLYVFPKAANGDRLEATGVSLGSEDKYTWELTP